MKIGDQFYYTNNFKNYTVFGMHADVNCAYLCYFEGSMSDIQVVYFGPKHDKAFQRDWSKTNWEAIRKRHKVLLNNLLSFEEVYSASLLDPSTATYTGKRAEEAQNLLAKMARIKDRLGNTLRGDIEAFFEKYGLY